MPAKNRLSDRMMGAASGTSVTGDPALAELLAAQQADPAPAIEQVAPPAPEPEDDPEPEPVAAPTPAPAATTRTRTAAQSRPAAPVTDLATRKPAQQTPEQAPDPEQKKVPRVAERSKRRAARRLTVDMDPDQARELAMLGARFDQPKAVLIREMVRMVIDDPGMQRKLGERLTALGAKLEWDD